MLFLYENLGDCMKESVSRSFWLFIPVVVVLIEGFFLTYTPSYINERAVLVVLLNFSLANITYNLMLTNMAKKPFKFLQMGYLFPLIPLVSYWV